MQQGLRQQDLAVATGYWPLFRYNPAMREAGANPFRLDSPRPTHAVPRLRLQRGALQGAGADPPGGGGGAAGAAPSRRSTRNTGCTKTWRAGRIPASTRPSRREDDHADLTTRYLGLTLRNPLIASASPLTLDARQHPRAGGCRRRRRWCCPRCSRSRSSRRRRSCEAAMGAGRRQLRRGLQLSCRRSPGTAARI